MNTVRLKELGPQLWFLIHTFAGSYHSINKEGPFLDFIKFIKLYLPCDICRSHFQTMLQTYRFDKYTKNNEDVLKWTYLLHAAVNKRKNVASPEFEEVKRKYIFERDNRGYELNFAIWPVLFTFSQLDIPRHTFLHFFYTILTLMDPEVSAIYRQEIRSSPPPPSENILPWLYHLYRLHPENIVPFHPIHDKYTNKEYNTSIRQCRI